MHGGPMVRDRRPCEESSPNAARAAEHNRSWRRSIIAGAEDRFPCSIGTDMRTQMDCDHAVHVGASTPTESPIMGESAEAVLQPRWPVGT